VIKFSPIFYLRIMKAIAVLIFVIAHLLFSSFGTKPPAYDVCVYGGTSAGVIAAYTAAKMGKRVILVEPGKHLGGLSAGGLGYTDIGNKYAITGLAREFYRKIGKHYGKFEKWIFEPHVAEDIFKEYARHVNIQVIYDHRIIKANKSNGVISQVVLENSQSSSSASKTISAKMFIDCSYEGDLMAMAGVSYMVGRESNSLYNETYNGVQLMKGHQFPDGVDPYKIPGDPSSGLLWGIDTAQLASKGTGDKKVQAYNYRICLTNDPKNRVEIIMPETYDASKYDLLVRLFQAQPEKKNLNDYFIMSRMPHGKTDINNRGGFSTDMIGMNHGYPNASYQERLAIIRQHDDYTKGLLYFYGHDPRVPEALRDQMLQWGYPGDEYKDNNNWSHQLYIRESRRMLGEYVMTQHNCQGREVITDGIGLAAYTMDSHNCQRIVVNGMVKNEGNVEIGGFGPYPISYRAIIPRKAECVNLYVPVCLSASHIAYGSIRMEPVFMVLAQSAAVAACMAIDEQQTIHDVDTKKLQALLKKDPLMDGSIPDILVDNDDSSSIIINGKWKRLTSEMDLGYTGNYGPSLLMADTANALGNKVTFLPLIPVAGNYKVYSYFVKTPKTSNKTRLVVNDGKMSKDIIISKSEIAIEGQTSGEWVYLGNFLLPKGKKSSVTITDKDADGTIVADAILLVHEK